MKKIKNNVLRYNVTHFLFFTHYSSPLFSTFINECPSREDSCILSKQHGQTTAYTSLQPPQLIIANTIWIIETRITAGCPLE
mmetsp:Transcript_2143/g.3308  ORF Transcript_2143/g.3308 Transcript_2143/m.3308 type:complete len:82 (-) Transcript_2143:1382-1627(-)